MKTIVMSGVQGSGKGTQARKLVEAYGYRLFEMGSALRVFAKGNHPRAEETDRILQSGAHVPTEIVRSVLEDYIASSGGHPTIYDGVIRNMDQENSYGTTLGDFIVLWCEISREEAIRRLSGRRYDPTTQETFGADFTGDVNPKTGVKLMTRHDDTPEAIAQRIDLFYEKTLPLVAIWEARGIPVHRIDSMRPIEEVFADICRIIEQYR